MATVQEVADAIAQADREYNAKWMSGLQWEQGENKYHVTDNAAWQSERGGSDIWLSPDEINHARNQYRKQKVSQTFGDVDPDTYDQALSQ